MERGLLLLEMLHITLVDESVHKYWLTLGAHAQRGLQYLLCVSVCLFVCYRSSNYSVRFNLQ